MGELVSIDGSFGEGGGQILRTAVGLCPALGVNIHISNIRSGRPKPGLGRQHLTGVHAAAQICNAQVTGTELGSSELTFNPGRPHPGCYNLQVGTAGSTSLVLQTVIPGLMISAGESAVTVTGGTHNPFAPCFEYVRDVFAVLAAAANLHAYFEIRRAGFYPAGGGEVIMKIRGVESMEHVSPIRLLERGDLKYIEGISAVSSKLPGDIAERQAHQVIAQLRQAGRRASIEQTVWDTACPGTVVFLRAVFSRTVAGFAALGERGKPAERVADEAVAELLEYLDSPGVADPRAADQLITIAALSPRESSFTTTRITQHLLTNAEVIRQVAKRDVVIEGSIGQAGSVTIKAV